MERFTFRQSAVKLVRFSLPLILSGVLQQLYHWADAFITGHFIGEDALAAIGCTGSVNSLFLRFISGFTMGLSVLAAQRYGEKKHAEVSSILHLFLRILLPFALAFMTIGLIVSKPMLVAMATPDNLLMSAAEYLRIILIGLPFMTVYNLYSAILRAVGDSKAPFYAVLISSVMNVLLDCLFVIRFHWGVAGTAAATVLAQISMTVWIVIYTRSTKPTLRSISMESTPRSTLKDGLRLGLPLTLQSIIGSAGSLMLQGFMNGFGSHTVAAITSAYRVDSVMMLPLINLSTAISTMVAQCKGAGNKEQMRRFTYTGLILSVIIGALLMVTMYSFGGDIVAFFGIEQEAIAVGRDFFRNISKYYILFALVCALSGNVKGRGSVVYDSTISILSLGVRIALSFITVSRFANMAIAHAEGLSWLFEVLCYIGFFFGTSPSRKKR